MHVYVGNGSTLGNNTSWTTLTTSSPTVPAPVGTAPTLANYDLLLLPCWGIAPPGTTERRPTIRRRPIKQNVVAYTNAGGRVFATHYSYSWLYRQPVFDTTANWNNVDQTPRPGDPLTAVIDQTFPKGVAFAQWLVNVGAGAVVNNQTQIQINGAAPRSRYARGTVAAVDFLDGGHPRQHDHPALHVQHAGRHARGDAVRARAVQRLPRRELVERKASASRPSAGSTRR